MKPIEKARATGRQDPIRVLLADHAAFRKGLEEMLSTDGDIHVVAQAENGAQALALAKEVRPDVVVLDLGMPLMGGEEATELIPAGGLAPARGRDPHHA